MNFTTNTDLLHAAHARFSAKPAPSTPPLIPFSRISENAPLNQEVPWPYIPEIEIAHVAFSHVVSSFPMRQYPINSSPAQINSRRSPPQVPQPRRKVIKTFLEIK